MAVPDDTVLQGTAQAATVTGGVDVVQGAGTARARGSPWTDVWSRTQPKYRWRAILLLALNCALFFLLGCFAFWLRTGEAVPFLTADYWDLFWRCFDPREERQITLIDFLLAPINAQQAPMQIVVLGLLMASFVSIPILVAMLYRLPSAIFFILVIAFVAVLPWLAVTITLSCVLTRVRPLQFSFRFATAMIALIPVLLYFYNATRHPPIEASYTTPIAWASLYAPWLLAILASCLVMGVVLLVARLVDYRPGALSPLLAILFVSPAILFEAWVGRDELYYRLLEKEFGPRSATRFRDQEASAVIRRFAEREYAAQFQQTGSSSPPRSVEAIERALRSRWMYQPDPLNEADTQLNRFQLEQYEAGVACDRFRDDYPKSRYLPNVLYIKGRAQDARIDLEAFRRTGDLHYYQDFPSHVSASTWATLCEQYPDSPAASVALYRLAQLEARAGNIDRALERLDTLIERFGTADPAVATAPGRSPAGLGKVTPTSTLDIQVRSVVGEARVFRDLLRLNRDPDLSAPPDITADAPLVRLLRCDPRHRLFAQNLQQLIDRYPGSRLRDNLILEREKTLNARSDSLKIDALERFIKAFADVPGVDALPEAWYRLGEAYLADSRPADALRTFERVVKDYPDTAWAQWAGKQVAALAVLRAAPVGKASTSQP